MQLRYSSGAVLEELSSFGAGLANYRVVLAHLSHSCSAVLEQLCDIFGEVLGQLCGGILAERWHSSGKVSE